MFEVNNYSRSVVSFESRMNELISNTLIRLVVLYEKRKEEKVDLTETECNIFKILDTLSEDEYNCLKEFLNIINSGVLKYLNKYYIIDIELSTIPSSFISKIEVYCKLISDSDVFRKINKKLDKEDENIFVTNKLGDELPSTIETIVQISYTTLSNIINEVMKTDDNNFKYYNFTCNSIEELNKTLDTNITFFERNIIRKFQL